MGGASRGSSAARSRSSRRADLDPQQLDLAEPGSRLHERLQYGGSGRYDARFGLQCAQPYRLFSLISGVGSDATRYADNGVGTDTWYTAGS